MTIETNKRPDTELILNGLKDFQRATVEHVFDRLYGSPTPSHRYLVADEVGLGKTLVARGVIAKTIDHLWDKEQRIDIVYVCSNSDIARQNINRMNVIGGNEFKFASRITMLPLLRNDSKKQTLDNFDDQRVNFVSFTPGTSFELHGSGGVARERALLFWMLRDAWDLNEKLSSRPFEGNSGRQGFQYELNFVDPAGGRVSIHSGMQSDFIAAVNKEPQYRITYEELLKQFPPRKEEIPDVLRSECLAWIGSLRQLLAETCLHWLEPDLIILDEFQRFKHLMNGKGEKATPAAELAEHLFSFQRNGNAARVMLLSATPYKMYTTSEETETDDHYGDFRLTLNFLISDLDQREEFERLLSQYREELFRIRDHGFDGLLEVKCKLEDLLRTVMVRTERLAIHAERNGMLVPIEMPGLTLEATDVRHYLGLQRIAKHLSHGDMLEYWKSAPYLLNFMEHYDIKRKLEKQIKEQVDAALAKAVRPLLLLDGMLNRDTIESYGKLDPGNAKMRALATDTIGREAWRLLWIPPSMPYYNGSGPYSDPELELGRYTKRLVFSCWKVVPKAIASMLSYEAERQMMRQFRKKAKNTDEARDKRRPLLQFRAPKGQPSAMSALGILYPCRTMATRFDPLKLLKSPLATEADAITVAKQAVTELLSPILATHRNDSEVVDQRWYWVAPLLMDLHHFAEETEAWLQQANLAAIWAGTSNDDQEDIAGGWIQHIENFRSIAENSSDLGQPPDDLCVVLGKMALASPGVVALRSFGRVIGNASSDPKEPINLCNYAAAIAHSFVTLFNHPEVMYLLRGSQREVRYWESVLDYAISGNLQAMSDEYFHILVESLGVRGKSQVEFASQITKEFSEALLLGAGYSQADMFSTTPRRVVSEKPLRMPNRFAMRFGVRERDDTEETTRPAQLQSAFNSPFWPFVLASTSVGQEGLDFHPYCHAVVHWNLPSNPVDLEQREGRVHRYKGHALRKNIASAFSDSAISSCQPDP
ncbi:MAG TPA: DEAD/DEAH box helicase [Planctomycetaceae bacterium]|nr:DEAD/DEAH box helicase [Planctomycetaceae bacterium]